MALAVEMRELYRAPRATVDISLATSSTTNPIFRPAGRPQTSKSVRSLVEADTARSIGSWIGTLVDERGTAARIKSHAKSHIVELTDGSKWHIWPGDLATTLGWTPDAKIEALPIEDEFCSHVLVQQSDGSRVRATDASNDWPIEKLRKSLRGG